MLLLGKNETKKLDQISLSDNTVQCQKSNIFNGIKARVIQAQIKTASILSIQLDDSMDVQASSQPIDFARYPHDRVLKEKFLFCIPLQLTPAGCDGQIR